MKLFKYGQFLSSQSGRSLNENYEMINENYEKSLSMFKLSAKFRAAAKELGRLTPELAEKEVLTPHDFGSDKEVRDLAKVTEPDKKELDDMKNHPNFIKLVNLLGQKSGLIHPFAYFHFVEGVPIDELIGENGLYNRVMSLGKELLKRLVDADGNPKPFEQDYIDVRLPPNKIGNNYERLLDSLNRLGGSRKVKKIYDKLTPVLKEQYDNATLFQQKKFTEIANGFITGDEKRDKKVQDGFFATMTVCEKDEVVRGVSYKKGDLKPTGQIGKFTTLDQFISKAFDYLEGIKNEDKLAFYETINKCNRKYGLRGNALLFDEKGIIVLEVRSWLANVMLNSRTAHCIKDSEYQWDNYITNTDGMQYYIYNFNVAEGNIDSVIGITILPDGKIRAAHKKNDQWCGDTINTLLKDWSDRYGLSIDINTLLQPMTPEKVEFNKKRREAEKQIVKPGISLEQIRTFVQDFGANPNKDRGQPLANAIDERDLDKINLLIELGADPNSREDSPLINRLSLSEQDPNRIDDPAYQAEMYEILKVLVKAGAKLTPVVSKYYYTNYDAIKFFLESGMDPNIDTSAPLRLTMKGSHVSKQNMGSVNEDIYDLLLEWGADPTVPIVSKWAAEYGRVEMLEKIFNHFIKKGKKQFLTDPVRKITHSKTGSFIEELINWASKCIKVTPEKKQEVIDYLTQKQIELGGGEGSV